MIIVLGLIVLVAAVVVGVAGVLGNAGEVHALTHGFSVFGYHVTGSTGTLFLYGIVVGAVAVLGLSLLLASASRESRRGRSARRSLEKSRHDAAVIGQDRDDLIDERDAARAETIQVRQDASSTVDREPALSHAPRSRRHRIGRRADHDVPMNS